MIGDHLQAAKAHIDNTLEDLVICSELAEFCSKEEHFEDSREDLRYMRSKVDEILLLAGTVAQKVGSRA